MRQARARAAKTKEERTSVDREENARSDREQKQVLRNHRDGVTCREEGEDAGSENEEPPRSSGPSGCAGSLVVLAAVHFERRLRRDRSKGSDKMARRWGTERGRTYPEPGHTASSVSTSSPESAHVVLMRDSESHGALCIDDCGKRSYMSASGPPNFRGVRLGLLTVHSVEICVEEPLVYQPSAVLTGSERRSTCSLHKTCNTSVRHLGQRPRLTGHRKNRSFSTHVRQRYGNMSQSAFRSSRRSTKSAGSDQTSCRNLAAVARRLPVTPIAMDVQ